MPTTIDATRAPEESLLGYTHIIYALHALSGIIGLTSSATVIGSFVFGIPSIIAVIMNYLRREQVRGTILESHFRWQIRTFWSALLLGLGLYGLVALLTVFGFMSALAGAITGGLSWIGVGAAVVGIWLTLTIGATVVGIWVLYRVARGWLALRDGRAMYV
jgi:uncharacterized membrane protein